MHFPRCGFEIRSPEPNHRDIDQGKRKISYRQLKEAYQITPYASLFWLSYVDARERESGSLSRSGLDKVHDRVAWPRAVQIKSNQFVRDRAGSKYSRSR